MKPEETDGATIALVDLQGKNLFSVNTLLHFVWIT